VWTVSLDVEPAQLTEAAALLAEDERTRAGRYRFARDRAMFILGRAALRRILAAYLSMRPADVKLRSGRFGKPGLDPSIHGCDLRFNASGSGSLSVYAMALGQEVGIDLEHARPIPDLGRVADLVLSPRERAVFVLLDDASRPDYFLDAWTRKEAYLKARGEGLQRAPTCVEFGALLGEIPASIRDVEDPGAASRWWVTAWRPAPDYAAAMVTEGRPGRVVHLNELHDTVSASDASFRTHGREALLPC
jgi:4'-phosphopantetheinyl transferase